MLDENRVPDEQPEELNSAPDTAVSEENEMGFLSARYQQMNDEQVVEMCHQGDSEAEEYLLNKYKNFVRAKARSYFLIGADHEDIVQEGMIGLYKAIRDFKPEKLSSFRAFAELCITRQIITAIKTATRQKHIPLNSYVSLNKPLYDEESDRTLLDVIMEGRISDPEELIINRENLGNIHNKISEVLSGLEQEVLQAYLDGKSYQEIADALGRHVKSIGKVGITDRLSVCALVFRNGSGGFGRIRRFIIFFSLIGFACFRGCFFRFIRNRNPGGILADSFVDNRLQDNR